MEKPTIFFSHSAKDRNVILPIKEKLIKITSGVIQIFMSSDGQSIPFGNNWIHKIEDGLNNAKIMFVFVTPTSIESGWIYFEAGFAYSKGIDVIPVGVGIDIGSIRPPLSLLQGFNITSSEMHKSARVCHLHGENLPQHRRLSATSPAPLPPKSSAGNPTDRARRY